MNNNCDFLNNCLDSLIINFENFMIENQYEEKILELIDNERLVQIQEILGLEMNCWLKLLERISLSLINFSVDSLRRSLTINSSAYKSRHANLQNVTNLSKKIFEIKEKMVEKCLEFKMKDMIKTLENNWILLEADGLRKTDNFASPNMSLYKRNEESAVNQGSVGFRLEGSKGSFLGI